MSKIIIIVDHFENKAKTAKAVRDVTKASLGDTLTSLSSQQPVINQNLFNNDQPEVSKKLKQLISSLDSLGDRYSIYELDESETEFSDTSKFELHKIPTQTMINILDRFDDDLERFQNEQR